MKKVNFNALQNFEVPESWIENAINAKPKKKPFYLNPRYYGTAAALVIAVGIAAFSLLYLNRDFTPPTGQNVEGTSVSSTLSGQRLTEILSGGEMKTTEIQNETKQTEKPNATGVTEQNEEIYEQEINSEEQDNESSESENHTPVRAEESEQDEQSNNTKKPESNIQPQNPSAPIEQQQNTEQKQESEKSEEELVHTTPQEENEQLITDWKVTVDYPIYSYSGTVKSSDDKKNLRLTSIDKVFTDKINISIPNEYKEKKCKKIKCSIVGSDENTTGENGTIIFSFEGYAIENLSVSLYEKDICIPCGNYNFTFEFFNYDVIGPNLIDEKVITVTLENDKDSIISLY